MTNKENGEYSGGNVGEERSRTVTRRERQIAGPPTLVLESSVSPHVVGLTFAEDERRGIPGIDRQGEGIGGDECDRQATHGTRLPLRGAWEDAGPFTPAWAPRSYGSLRAAE